MACTINFKGREIKEEDLIKYFNDLKGTVGTPTGFTPEEFAEINRVLDRATLENATYAQKFAIHQLIKKHLGIKPVGDTHYEEGGKKFMRVSNAIGIIPEFEFVGNDADYEINRRWGTEINEIFDMAISGTPISEFSSDIISDEVAKDLYDQFRDYDFGEGSVVMTQMRLSSESLNKNGKKYKDKDGNEYDGVAGTADIIVIDKNGVIKVLDLKSSVNPTSRPYQKIKNGVVYTNEYGKRVLKNKASKKETHAIQLSAYYYMLKNMGFSMVTKNPIGVLPVHISRTIGDKVVDTEIEDLINNHEINVEFSGLDTTNNNEKIDSLLRKIKINLGERLQKAENEGKPTYFINQLIESMQGLDSAIAIEEFIKEIKSSMYGGPNFRGYKERLDHYITNYNASTDEDAKLDYMNQVQAIKEIVDSLLESDIMKDLKIMILSGDYDNMSLLSDVKSLIDTMEFMKSKYDAMMLEMIADTLAKQITPDMLENLVNSVKDLERSLQVLIDRNNKKPTKRLKKRIEKLTNQINEEKKRLYMDVDYNIDFKRVLMSEIEKGGYKDPSFMDRLFTPVVSIDNSFMATFALTVKQALEEVRRKTIEITDRTRPKFEKFLGGRSLINNPPEELYKDFQTEITINGKQVLSARTLIDWSKFLSEKKKAFDEYKEQYGYGTPEYSKAIQDWYINNTEQRPDDDIVVSGLVVVEGQNTIKNRKKNQMSKRAYDNWLQSEPFELNMPKLSIYEDAMFNKIKDNEFYIEMMKLLMDAQAMLPQRRNDYEKYILPFISKSSVDRFRENAIKEGNLKDYISYEIRDRFSLTSNDYNSDNYDKNSSETKSIPVMYYNRDNLMDAKDTTKDMYLSILKFHDAAMKYSVQSKYRVIGDNLLGYVKDAKPALTDFSGVKILSKVAKLVGLENTIDDYVKKSNSNVAAMLEMFIDVTIYGRTKYNETVKLGMLDKTIDIGKIADSIMSFSAGTQIALNPYLYVANTLQGNAANLVDGSAKGLWKSTKTWAKAKKLYYWDGSLGGIADTFLPDVKTKINLMTQRYDPVQGDFYNQFGKKLTRSQANRMFSTSTGYALSHIAEHQIQVQGMIAQMLETELTRVVNGVETKINMFDALEVVNGELKYKDGVVEPNEQRFMNIMHAKNKRLHGIYNDFDVVELNRSSIGRLILFYRKFLPAGMKYRFKSRGFDYELGDYTYGIYRAFYSKLFFETGELLRAIQGKDTTLTELEKRSAMKAAMEHLLLATTGALVWILTMAREGADDEDKTKYSYLLYFTMRLNAEISIYGGVSDPRMPFVPNFDQMLSPFYTPTAAFGVLTKATRLYYYAINDMFSLAGGNDIERYLRDSGQFEKGDSKTYAALIKLLGFNKNLTDIDAALEQLLLVKGINR